MIRRSLIVAAVLASSSAAHAGVVVSWFDDTDTKTMAGVVFRELEIDCPVTDSGVDCIKDEVVDVAALGIDPAAYNAAQVFLSDFHIEYVSPGAYQELWRLWGGVELTNYVGGKVYFRSHGYLSDDVGSLRRHYGYTFVATILLYNDLPGQKPVTFVTEPAESGWSDCPPGPTCQKTFEFDGPLQGLETDTTFRAAYIRHFNIVSDKPVAPTALTLNLKNFDPDPTKPSVEFDCGGSEPTSSISLHCWVEAVAVAHYDKNVATPGPQSEPFTSLDQYASHSLTDSAPSTIAGVYAGLQGFSVEPKPGNNPYGFFGMTSGIDGLTFQSGSVSYDVYAGFADQPSPMPVDSMTIYYQQAQFYKP